MRKGLDSRPVEGFWQEVVGGLVENPLQRVSENLLSKVKTVCQQRVLVPSSEVSRKNSRISDDPVCKLLNSLVRHERRDVDFDETNNVFVKQLDSRCHRLERKHCQRHFNQF